MHALTHSPHVIGAKAVLLLLDDTVLPSARISIPTVLSCLLPLEISIIFPSFGDDGSLRFGAGLLLTTKLPRSA